MCTDNGPGGLDNVYNKTLDISSFRGETVYVAFRHHDITDVFRIALDNIKVEAGSLGVKDNLIQGFTHFFDASNATLTMQADNVLEHFELYNIMGQKVFAQDLDSNNVSIDLLGLSSGVYISKVKDGVHTNTFKIAIK